MVGRLVDGAIDWASAVRGRSRVRRRALIARDVVAVFPRAAANAYRRWRTHSLIGRRARCTTPAPVRDDASFFRHNKQRAQETSSAIDGPLCHGPRQLRLPQSLGTPNSDKRFFLLNAGSILLRGGAAAGSALRERSSAADHPVVRTRHSVLVARHPHFYWPSRHH